MRLPTGVESRDIVWWYATNLAAVCLFKSADAAFLYTRELAIGPAVEAGAYGGSLLEIALFFAADVVQIGLLVLAVFVVGNRLLAGRFNALMAVATLTILSIGTANLVSLAELSAPLSFETLRLSIDWAALDPSVMSPYTNKRYLLGAALVAAWLALPFMLSGWDASLRGSHPGRAARWALIYRAGVTFVIVGAGALAYRVLNAEWPVIVTFGFAAALSMPRYLPGFRGRPSPSRHLKPIALTTAAVAFGASGVFRLAEAVHPAEPDAPLYAGHLVALTSYLAGTEVTDYANLPRHSARELRERYRALAYPEGRPAESSALVELEPSDARPRHIVVIGLETAAEDYYPLFDDPALEHLNRLSRRALVSERHLSTTPFTTRATASVLSGLYTAPVNDARGFSPDALPRVLRRHGYHTHHIDSFVIDWRSGPPKYRWLYESLGTEHITDATDIPGFDRRERSFDYRSRIETESMKRAYAAIRDAEAAGTHAFVYIQTVLGHYPWNAPPEHEQDSARDRLYGLAREYDRLVGVLLERLENADLVDETIFVVTGDHGLRYRGELESVGRELGDFEAAFNVPLVLSAPGIFERQVRVPFVTSHVDLAPTLLRLVGVGTDGLLHHGADILSGAPAGRVTYVLNRGLSPIDGLHWNGVFFTHDSRRRSTGKAEFAAAGEADAPPLPASLAPIDRHLAQAGRLFDLTVAHFMRPDAERERERETRRQQDAVDISALP